MRKILRAGIGVLIMYGVACVSYQLGYAYAKAEKGEV